ncbi:MAG: hypothetical protein KatS3mg072_2298 [Meiothermus sp.]|nr:MAG: hypothetical protein KatS3mg072_2298 [Meiothermus sp.]
MFLSRASLLEHLLWHKSKQFFGLAPQKSEPLTDLALPWDEVMRLAES